MKWDLEVDVVCTGAGVAGLAHSVAVVDMDGEVFVASADDARSGGTPVAVRSRVDRLHWLDLHVSDPETNEYFAALSSDLGPLTRFAGDVDLPIRVVEQAQPVQARGAVPPFVGARLRDWAARCLVSPYGYLSTRVVDWQSTTLRTADGEAIEVAEIGSIAPDPDNVGGSVMEWLTAKARDRDIEVSHATSLERIVFEEGEVLGAEFMTPDGRLAVRARHGVTVAAGGPQAATGAGRPLPADAALRLCLVSRPASRFGRLELLSSEPLPKSVASTCRAMSRRLPANMREAHTRLQTLRCGKVDGYPAPGQ
ncbi:FAD-binding protein [Mycobacterium sp. 3519A]|uniref:FAD-binding protein n=1 Tax=Mycobacterium sp. 3519A TaxID=2057184 RepID=UPI000C7B1560|nr:FAD-binding protein [Mycobacterium sp. 3519A]